ncbi:hypothetical protein [Glutamicibacter sp.]|uniref:hypothetical protein n=1 Tax=Glutamicibacter sp. TaxID=1931995 RepID=UPI0028BD778F|nr:hypothetical protein [Glutamicibacter sp.]
MIEAPVGFPPTGASPFFIPSFDDIHQGPVSPGPKIKKQLIKVHPMVAIPVPDPQQPQSQYLSALHLSGSSLKALTPKKLETILLFTLIDRLEV